MGHKVEISRHRYGEKDEDEVVFSNLPEALAWGKQMLLHYHYRVWIDGSEWSRKDFIKKSNA